MAAGGVAGGAHTPDHLVHLHLLAHLDVGRGEVPVVRAHVVAQDLAVVDGHHAAVAAGPTDEGDPAVGRRTDGSATGGCEVEAGVELPDAQHRVEPHTEFGGASAGDGHREHFAAAIVHERRRFRRCWPFPLPFGAGQERVVGVGEDVEDRVDARCGGRGGRLGAAVRNLEDDLRFTRRRCGRFGDDFHRVVDAGARDGADTSLRGHGDRGSPDHQCRGCRCCYPQRQAHPIMEPRMRGQNCCSGNIDRRAKPDPSPDQRDAKSPAHRADHRRVGTALP